jgi:hypothetical protein
MSDCRAMRLRSRQVSWKMGSWPAFFEVHTGGQRAQPHHGALVVGHIDGVHLTQQMLGLLGAGGHLGFVPGHRSLDGAHFSGDNKLAFGEQIGQFHFIQLLAGLSSPDYLILAADGDGAFLAMKGGLL